MLKNIILFLLPLIGIFIIDQNIKMIFVDGFRYYTNYMDLILVYNKGVAFSMFAFLEEGLKWIQLALLAGVSAYIIFLRQRCYMIPVGILIGAGLSNVYDRFVHGGVVDMFYWHGWPYPIAGQNGFAVFNFADVMIDVAVVILLVLNFRPKFCQNK